MRVLDPGPKAVIREECRESGIRSMTITFEAPMEMLPVLHEMLNGNEKFYTLLPGGALRSWKIPTLVREMFVPAPTNYDMEPKARVHLQSVGAPEAYMQIGFRQPTTGIIHDVMYRHPNCRCVITGTDLMSNALKQMKGRIEREFHSYLHKEVTGSFTKTEKEKDKKMDKKTLKANRFYVGSPRALRDGWGKPTLAEAVEHAKEQLEATGNEQFVVQIVRVVKKKEQPVIVETVK